MLLTRPALAALPLLAFAAPLAAQGSPAALHEVMRGDDGTTVAIDSASISHPRDSAFVVWTEVRFPQPLELDGGQRFDREVDAEELDCGSARMRGLWSTLHLDTATVRRLALSREWTAVAEERRPLFDARCAWLLGSFAARLPTGYEVRAVDEQPELENRDAVAHAIAHAYPESLLTTGSHATFMVRMRVRADGSVERETIQVTEADDRRFSGRAIRVAQVMRFRPGRVAGVAVPTWITLPVAFGSETPPRP